MALTSPSSAPDADVVWSESNLSDPHAAADKAARVRAMFAAIAPSYDLNNRLHSLWRDQAWRRAAVKMAAVKPGDVVLDVACGTGDLALAFARGEAAAVIGVDFTFDMLAVAARKSAAAYRPALSLTHDRSAPLPASPTRGEGKAALLPASPRGGGELKQTLSYVNADAMRLPVADASVDVVSIAFGIRNVIDPAAAVGEFRRVLRPGGRLVILEFSLPANPLLRRLYNLYFQHVMPRTAALIARDRSGAYKYLPRSVSTFIDRRRMTTLLSDVGFTDVQVKPLTMGIAVIYKAVK